MKRKILIGLGVFTLLLLAPLGLVMSTFIGLKPIPETTELPGGALAVKDGFVQAFILPAGDGGAVLIDCGPDPEAKAIKAQLARAGLTVRAVFLTHGHGDHVSGCAAFPGAELYAMGADKAILEGTEAPKGPFTRFGKNDPTKVAKLSRALADGAVEVLGSLKIKAYAIPGHTAGSAAFLANGVLFLGDAVAGQEDGKVRGPPWLFSDDAPQGAASVRALAKRLAADGERVKTLAFAHSGAFEGLDPLLAF